MSDLADATGTDSAKYSGDCTAFPKDPYRYKGYAESREVLIYCVCVMFVIRVSRVLYTLHREQKGN